MNLKYSPFDGNEWVGSRVPADWCRDHYPGVRWLYNPWTGQVRDPRAVESDPYGLALVAPGEEILNRHLGPVADTVVGMPPQAKSNVPYGASQGAAIGGAQHLTEAAQSNAVINKASVPIPTNGGTTSQGYREMADTVGRLQAAAEAKINDILRPHPETLWTEAIPTSTPQDTITDTLTERGKRYGKFTGHAEITQSLKAVMHGCSKWAGLAPDQKEALEMVVHKIGRILNGDPSYGDSWVDIAGYAKLVADRLEGVER